MKRVQILGVPVHSVTAVRVQELLHEYLAEPMFHLVCTPNNEIILQAQKNPHLLKVLHASDLNIPDSTGLLLAAKLTGQHLVARVTGVDTMQTFCSLLTNETPVFLLGAAEGVASKAAQKLQLYNPQLVVAGTYSGSPAADEAEHICQTITASGAKVLFVAFGAPKQEIWLHTYKHLLPTVRIGMGVGGSFDFISGTVQRAPALMRAIGLEWLWRLLIQPSRIPRIWNATVVFTLYVLRYGKNTVDK